MKKEAKMKFTSRWFSLETENITNKEVVIIITIVIAVVLLAVVLW